ncbi:4622_t:CDS:2 [Paraglomus brasilianum]|uniref:4622_t:CDS:1 n=1 Tax=Paraglomus brasilianum TaxID=144538 RepID=A0A9N9CRQ1_9GLOM|nr:4622_t:CDS:2 [Paraglomus brasilianum]
MAELLNAQPANYTRPPNPPAIVDEPFNATVKTIRILDFLPTMILKSARELTPFLLLLGQSGHGQFVYNPSVTGAFIEISNIRWWVNSNIGWVCGMNTNARIVTVFPENINDGPDKDDGSGTTLTTLSPKTVFVEVPIQARWTRRICDLYSLSCVICSDGIRQGSEECDDGNLDPGRIKSVARKSVAIFVLILTPLTKNVIGPIHLSASSNVETASLTLRLKNVMTEINAMATDAAPPASANLCVLSCVCRPGFKADANNDQKAIHWRLQAMNTASL